jgi:hypothetical protein
MIPQTLPSELPASLRQLYNRLVHSGPYYQMDRDRSGKPAQRAELEQLEQLGLGKLSSANAFWVQALHPAVTALSDGDPERRYGWYGELSLLDGRYGDEQGRLLTCLDGMTLGAADSRSGEQTWKLSLTHFSATDLAHDSMYLTRMQLTYLHPMTVSENTLVFRARLTPEIRMWGWHIDPFTVSDGDYQAPAPGQPSLMCTTQCEQHHRFGPYLAPENPQLEALAFHPVELRLWRRDQVDEQGRPLPTVEQAE